MAAALRVHLADEHAMFREGLAAILSSREGIEVVGQSGTGPGAAAEVARTRPDVIVTQLEMKLGEVEKILGSLRRASPDSKIVVLTLWDHPRYLRAVAGMGIDALMHKSSTSGELVDVVEAASRSQGGQNAVVALPRSLLEMMDGGPAGGLSERELEVLVLASRGLSNRRIAQELYLSETTVKRHLVNVYQKMGVRSRNEAVRKALMEELVGLHEIAATDGRAGEQPKRPPA
jgi:DNA-binding NarL/FixJ family response regulator